jgi:hypothetical protein
MIRFATIAPVKAAWMIKDGGEWFVSAEGKSMFEISGPEEFRQESRRLYHQWLRMRPKN